MCKPVLTEHGNLARGRPPPAIPQPNSLASQNIGRELIRSEFLSGGEQGNYRIRPDLPFRTSQGLRPPGLRRSTTASATQVREQPAHCGSATSGGQRSLCEGACGGISGGAPRGGRAFAVLCVARDHGAGQGMRQSRRDAVLGGAVVVQIFMQPRPLLRAPRWSSPRWSQTRRPGVCRNRRRRHHTFAASCVPAQLRRRPLRVPARPSRRVACFQRVR